jgi:hypothetical protein
MAHEIAAGCMDIKDPRIEGDIIIVDKIMTSNDYLYIFLDNLHDFADEGSLNDDKFLDIGVIALCIAYTFAVDGEEINHILDIFKSALIEVDENLESFFNDKETETETAFKELIIGDPTHLKKVFPINDIKSFLTSRKKDGQQLLYKKLYDEDRLFTKNPTVREETNKYYLVDKDIVDDPRLGIKKDLTPFVEVVTPENYLSGDTDANSFVETPAWNALLNASSAGYDGSDVFGQIDLLQNKVRNEPPGGVLKTILNEYKNAIEKKNYALKHKQQLKFDAIYGGRSDIKIDKTYLFAPDAVNKVRAMSSVFHEMQRLHKFGLSHLPTKQTVHNTSINFDMANSSITQPMDPNLGQLQRKTIDGTGVKELLEMGIRLNLCSHSGMKRMIIEQLPYINNKSRIFANQVFSIYNNMLVYFHSEIRQKIIDNDVAPGTEEYFTVVETEMKTFLSSSEDDEKVLHSPWNFMEEPADKTNCNWNDLAKRQLTIGAQQFDILTDIGIKDGTSLYQLMSVEAKDFYQEIEADDALRNLYLENDVATNSIFDDRTNRLRGTTEGDKNKYPYTSKTGANDAGKKMGPRKFYTSFKKPLPHEEDDGLGDFHSYLLYLFMCDIQVSVQEDGNKRYDKNDIPTINNSLILSEFLEHYKNIIEEDTYLSVSFPVKQTIHFQNWNVDNWVDSSDGYDQLKQGRKGPSVTSQEYNFRNLVLSMSKTVIEGETNEMNAPLSKLPNGFTVTNSALKKFINQNEERNPSRADKKKDDAGAKRGSKLHKDIKTTQTNMLKYLFSRSVVNIMDNPDGTYRNSYHEYILKSISKQQPDGNLNEFGYKQILGTVLWMPVATKWTSDFMQTIMNRAVLYLAQKSDVDYYNLFLPASFDITCACGGIKEGPMMFEMITGNGVLHAPNYDPILHTKRRRTLIENTILILSTLDKRDQLKGDVETYDKFKKTMLNFAPEVIDDYLKHMNASDELDKRDSIFIRNFYKNMTEGFTHHIFSVNLLLIHTLKMICFKLKSPQNKELIYQFKYLKELLQNSKNLKPPEFLHTMGDKDTENLMDVLKELNETKQIVLKQILNLEVVINEQKRIYGKEYYTLKGELLLLAEFETLMISDDEERDRFIDKSIQDQSKTLKWLNWNLDQIQKTIDKIIMNIKTRQSIEASTRFYDIARAELKTGYAQYSTATWLNNRSGVLRGDRLFYYYHPSGAAFNIKVLDTTIPRRGTFINKKTKEQKTYDDILQEKGKQRLDEDLRKELTRDYVQLTEEIKTYNDPGVAENRRKREEDAEYAVVDEMAAGSDKIWECCHKYLGLPDDKVDIEKIYEASSKKSEILKIQKEIDSVEIEGVEELQTRIDTLETELIESVVRIGEVNVPTQDTHQYKYMTAIQKFNNVSNPMENLTTIREGLMKTERFLSELENTTQIDTPVGSPTRVAGTMASPSTPNSAVSSPARPGSKTLVYSPGRAGESNTGPNKSAYHLTQEEYDMMIATIESLREANAELNKQIEWIQKERQVKIDSLKSKQGQGKNEYGAGKGGDSATGGMKIKIKYNTTQKIRRKTGRKSQNKRKKKGRGSKKHKRRKHRNTHKKALKIEH